MLQPPLWTVNLHQPPGLKMIVARGVFDAGERDFILHGHWALHLYDYDATLWMGEQELQVRPNTISLTPADMPVRYRWPKRSAHSGAHLLLGETDDSHARKANAIASIPAITDLGHHFEAFRNEFLEAVECKQIQPRRAQAIVWRLLWRLAETEPSMSADARLHPAVSKAVGIIETRLNDQLRVADLADEVELSNNQLTRLFNEQIGCTVIAYIRRQRIARAVHLLTESTLPIKAIAHEVGMPDLQRLNKLLREETGKSPSALREKR